MWWSKAVLIVAVLALGPSGCGFRPLYGKGPVDSGSAVSDDLSAVRVRAIDDRLGQQLRNSLVQRLSPAGEPGSPRYDLVVRLTKYVEGLGQQKDARSTLGRMTVLASYVLTRLGDGSEMQAGGFSGTARSVVSFNYLGARYASVAMERDAEERAVEDLAEGIRRQLAVRFTKRDFEDLSREPMR